MTRSEYETMTSWRGILFPIAGIVVAIALALLLIEQLSLRAAVQGGLIAIGAVIFSRLVLIWLGRRGRG